MTLSTIHLKTTKVLKALLAVGGLCNPIARVSCLLLTSFFVSSSASAQWVNESYPLKSGWNAIWLSQDCSDRPIEDLLATHTQIVEVWRWNPLGSSVQFSQSPDAPIKPDARWDVWRRGDHENSTLGAMTGNAAYLVSVASEAANFTLELVGKPLPPNYRFSSDGVNFLGFPAATPDSSASRNFESYFSYSSVLKSNPPVFFYKGGALSQVNPKNPVQVSTPRFTAVSRGKAYWVNSSEFTDYYGPIQVSLLGADGLDFGDKVNTVRLRVKNVTGVSRNQTVTATFTLSASEAAPGEALAAALVPLRVRGERDAFLQYIYNEIDGNPISVELAPGEEKELVFDANRTQMPLVGESYQAILQVTDSLGHTRIDLPVNAVGSSTAGVWVGAAVLDSVNQVELSKGPEFVAPLGTADGSVQESIHHEVITTTTSGGVSTETTRYVIDFDAQGTAYLETSGVNPSKLSLTSLNDNDSVADFTQNVDYTIAASSVALLRDSGSGYTAPPLVSFEGGLSEDGSGVAATATAQLSASVSKVEMTAGGSGYVVGQVDVSFIGGGGSGAAGFAVVSADGLITDVFITNGGSGYSSAPAVQFSDESGTGAVATVQISGGVGKVTLSSSGSGYVQAPTVVITASNGAGSGAEAQVVLSDSAGVTGVDQIQKVDPQSGPIPSKATVTIEHPSVAAPNTPNGTVVSTVVTTTNIVTLNGKSHRVEQRIASGDDAAAPSNFPIRLVLHAPETGPASLLQQVYLGDRDGVSYASTNENIIAGIVNGAGDSAPGQLGRSSSAYFPLGGKWSSTTGSWGDTLAFDVSLGFNDKTNPFVHAYHPDHDNWDARYERLLGNKEESYSVRRVITFSFSPTPLKGVSDIGWGVTTMGGTYTETFTGLRTQDISVSGQFIIHQVSDASILSQ